MCDFFFFNDTATTEIYTLSLHDALPIFGLDQRPDAGRLGRRRRETDVAPHSSRQAGVVGDLGPVLAAVGGLEQAAALAAGDELPGIALRLPERGIQHVGIGRVEHEVGDAGRYLPEHYLAP